MAWTPLNITTINQHVQYTNKEQQMMNNTKIKDHQSEASELKMIIE